MCRVAQPFFIRVAGRGTTRDGGKDGRPAVGSISNVTIEKVRVLATHHQTASSSTITACKEGVIKNIRFKDIYIEMPGGVAKARALARVDDHGYPQSNIFGDAPGYGFFVQHAENVTLEDVSVGYAKADVRPWLSVDHASVQSTRCMDLKKIPLAPLPSWVGR